jgi:glycosyltransferase involved in cell wall biosynthesis
MSKVSVVIPTYNRWPIVARALDSVFTQTHANLEVLVVDDGSTDGSVTNIHDQFHDPRLRVISLDSNHGVSAARNHGIRESTGEWVALLDSDDEWKPEKLEKQLTLAAETGQRVIHAEEVWIRNGSELKQLKKHRRPSGYVFRECLPLCCISPSTVMIRRSVFDSVGLFDEEFPVCEDYDMWLRVAARESVGLVPDVLTVKYGGHDDQLSRRFKAMDYWRVKAIARILSSGGLSPENHQAAVEALQNKAEILLRGYVKHNNFKDLPEVFALLKEWGEPGSELCELCRPALQGRHLSY